jgi:hypothetical protein
MKSRRVRWLGYVTRVGDRKGAYRDLVGKSEGKGPLGRPRHRCEDYIWVDLTVVVCEGVALNDVAQDRGRRMDEHGNKPSGSVECAEYPD